ncbi:MAG: hypothetical protein COC03_06290 [Robiginitomaculum sp.]|nr:MAG: hypothetical protein COC03_06290 [Robiginitomaculum sp.]PHQ66219.1 MAG: hypothetical protein COB92_08530 [Robiginitomaculum sp.]
MLLRSITKHINDQNWFAVAIDFFIVVGGVFIGLQVSNWSNAQQDRRDETAIIHALHSEITEAEELAANIVGKRTSYENSIAIATNVLFGLAPERALTQTECNALAYSHVLYFGRTNLPALERLQATGRLDIVRDANLNKALAKLLQRQEALDLTSKLRADAYDLGHLYPEIIELSSTLEHSDTREGLEREVTSTCNANAIKQNKGLMADIAINADTYDAFMRDGLRPWLAQIQEVHRQLDLTLNIQHNEGK